jgi:hypothetical protein
MVLLQTSRCGAQYVRDDGFRRDRAARRRRLLCAVDDGINRASCGQFHESDSVASEIGMIVVCLVYPKMSLAELRDEV